MSFTCNQARAPPEIPAVFEMKVLFEPKPPVALISLHNAPPYASALFSMNETLIRPVTVALESIAPPLKLAWFCLNITFLIELLLEIPFK